MDGGSPGTPGSSRLALSACSVERQLKKEDEPLQLGGRALDTLIALVERAGEVVTQRELIARVWPDVTVEEANLRVHIATSVRRWGWARGRSLHRDRPWSRVFLCRAGDVLHAAALTVETGRFSDRPAATQVDRMIGRDDTIRSLSAQLMMYRFVSIVGAAGIGKTTVAISVAHALLEGFDGAVFFIDLAALTDATLVPTAVARRSGLWRKRRIRCVVS